MGPKVNAKLSSASVEHFTPAAVVEAARFTLGRIALDPASCASANVMIQAEQYFDKSTDGLSQPWHGPVFLNPPGGRAERRYRDIRSNSNAVLWWAKLIDEWQRSSAIGQTSSGSLVYSSVSHSWSAIFVGFSLEILQAAQAYDGPQPLDFPVCIPSKRIKFDKADVYNNRQSGEQPTHGNVIVCVTSELEVARRFAYAFSTFGYVKGVR